MIALDQSFHESFNIFDMAKYLSVEVGITIGYSTMNVSIHEDNADELVLADLLPPKFTPHRKYYPSNTIWC